jgi:hypothetical protein
MTPAGWTLMLVSCSSVVTLAAYCYYKVLTTPQEPDDCGTPPQSDARRSGT